MGKSKYFLAALCCTVLVAAQAQENQLKFLSAWQASETFQKTTDEAGRAAIHDWMKQFAMRCSAQDASDAFSSLSRTSKALGLGSDFIEICAQRSADAAPEIKNTIASHLSDWYSAANDFDAALRVLAERLETWDGSASQRSSLAQKAASILSGRLQRHADAEKVFSSAKPKFTSEDDPSAVASLLNAYSSLLLSYFENLDGAEALTREVLAFGDKCSSQAYSTAAYQLAAIEKTKQNREGAVAACMLVLQHSSLPQAGAARRVVEAGANAAEMEKAIGLLRGRMTSDKQLGARLTTDNASEYQGRLERVQMEVLELLNALGRHEDAAKECRVLMFAGADRQYAQAVNLTARALKSLDGNLGRANAFLDFQQQGAASPSGNVLMTFAPLDDAVRTAALEKLADMPEPADWQSWLMRSANLLWLDRPADAMDAAAAAFAVCPISDAALQACATATTRPLLIATRDTTAAQALVDYLLYGSLGKDGIEGTSDDLADPFPEARRRLQPTVQKGR